MKPRLYFDTSVFGGINDVEFQEDSIKLFEMVKNSEIICVFSDLTEKELENAPEIVKNHFLSISSQHREIVSVTEDAYNLAENYIAEKVVGEKNVFRIKGYNAVNMKNGYIQLDIRSPKEIIRI